MPSDRNGSPAPRWTWWAWAALIVAALALPQSADAKRYPPPPEGWGAAIWRTAETVWGGPPPYCRTLDVRWGATLPPDREAEATRPIGRLVACVARFAPAHPRQGEQLCNAALHEYGHLMGVGHVSDPTSLMFGAPFASAENPWEYAGHPACWKFGHWQRWNAYLDSERAAGD